MSSPTAKVGPYALTQCVASGSSVQLWLAERTSDGGLETAAVRLVVDPKEDEMAVSQWQVELELHQQITQKSVPAIKAVFEDEKAFVVEWAPLLGLDELILGVMEGAYRLEAGSSVRIGLAVLDELREVQALGHVHGNLSPEKIRFRDDGQVLLYGFGTHPERVSPRYMVPEMAGEGEIGVPTDQWIVAALLFELLMGRPLYPGDWSTAFKRALDGDNLEACQALVARFPQVAQALLPALRAEGTEPYVSHDEMISALSSTLLMLGAGPSLMTVLTGAKERVESIADRDALPEMLPESESVEEIVVAPQLERVELPDVPPAKELVTASKAEVDELVEAVVEPPLQEMSLEPEPPRSEPPRSEPPRSDAAHVEVDAPSNTFSEPDTEEEPLSSGELEKPSEALNGALGQPLTDWEEAEVACCLGADPVERGSWWVSRTPEQTTVQKHADSSPPETDDLEPIALAQKDIVEEASVESVLKESPIDDSQSDVPEPILAVEETVAAAAYTPFPEVEPAAEVSFDSVEKEELVPPVLEELPAIPSLEPEKPVVQKPPRMPLPGLASVSEALLAEKEEAEPSTGDLPWDQPEVIIPAPVAPIQVEAPPPNTPDILSPRRPVSSRREEMVGWEHSWTVRPLSERIARGSLLVLLGMGLAWWVIG